MGHAGDRRQLLSSGAREGSKFEAASDNELVIGCAARSVVRAPRSTAFFKISTQVNDSARKIRVMLTAAKRENFSAPMVWTEECVLPLAAAGVYPKTRVWGSSEKTLHCFSATALLSGNSRRGWENSSGETALGSALDQDGNTADEGRFVRHDDLQLGILRTG